MQRRYDPRDTPGSKARPAASRPVAARREIAGPGFRYRSGNPKSSSASGCAQRYRPGMATAAGSVAVLSDIHGVLPVLDAVLAQPDVQAADLIVVCGDHAAGPQPVQVLDRLAAVGNAVLVRGNADRDLVALARGEYPPDEEPYSVDAWAAAQ